MKAIPAKLETASLLFGAYTANQTLILLVDSLTILLATRAFLNTHSFA